MNDVISFAGATAHALPLDVLVDQAHGCTVVARTWTREAAAECRRCDTCTARPCSPGAPEGAWHCLITAPGMLTPDEICELGNRQAGVRVERDAGRYSSGS